MPYIVVEDFRAGLDTRKLAAASAVGTLQKLSNGHITRGGEIEKRKAWVQQYALPAGLTHGFAGANGNLYTFGSADAAAAEPPGVIYQRLVNPAGAVMTAVTATEFFDGKVFVSAAYDNGSNLCFYDGARVTDWDVGSAAPVAGQKATSLLTLQTKLRATYSSVLASSAVATAASWNPLSTDTSGSSIINMSNQTAGSEALVGMGRYQNYCAIFARRNTEIWYLDPDPLQDARKQSLPNIGTRAHKSIVSYADSDVFFLADTGVRSLRARDASNQANVNDVGTSIDDELVAYMKTLPAGTIEGACAAVTPIDARYLLVAGPRAYVFSYFPTSRISAWSTYDMGFTATDVVVTADQMWARAGDAVYLYGGTDGETYDGSIVEVELPFIDGRSIATFKAFTGLDLICEGEWTVYAATDPQRPTVESKIATVNGTTINGLDIGMVGASPVIKLRLVNTAPGPAKLSKVIVHYKPTKEQG